MPETMTGNEHPGWWEETRPQRRTSLLSRFWHWREYWPVALFIEGVKDGTRDELAKPKYRKRK